MQNNKSHEKAPVLRLLLIGIVVYGIIAQVIGLIFSDNRFFYSTGLWIGILIAIGMAIHMNHTIFKYLDEDNSKGLRRGYPLRTLAAMAVIILAYYLKIGSVIGIFIGILSLKLSAYIVPTLGRIIGGNDIEKNKIVSVGLKEETVGNQEEVKLYDEEDTYSELGIIREEENE